MKCPKCEHENKTGRKFCSKCGTPLENICPKCGFKNDPEDEFCGECGTKIDEAKSDSTNVILPNFGDAYDKILRNIPRSMAEKLQPTTSAIEGENRMLSVLFGDVKGSVTLAEKMPPEDFADLINECVSVMVDVIWKYEGSVNRYPGDCVLAFFGTPIAHENDPERAIFAALEMREAVAKLNLRISIGINTGMVYVGAIGPDGHRETTAMGSAVNLASRLQGAASEQQSGETGLIIVGESTYRLTRRSYEFRELPPMKLKNIEMPTIAYEIIKPLPKPEKIRGIDGLRSEMIGRDNEFNDLKDSVDELLAGKGQIVSIIGEAGVGKSRLVSELRVYLGETQHVVSLLEGRCVSIGESIGYWVFVDILRSYMGFSDEDSPVEIREKIIDKMQAVFPQRWKDIIPYIGNMLSVRFEDELYEKMRHLPPEQIKHQTFMTLRDLFFTLSQQKPLILVFVN